MVVTITGSLWGIFSTCVLHYTLHDIIFYRQHCQHQQITTHSYNSIVQYEELIKNCYIARNEISKNVVKSKIFSFLTWMNRMAFEAGMISSTVGIMEYGVDNSTKTNILHLDTINVQEKPAEFDFSFASITRVTKFLMIFWGITWALLVFVLFGYFAFFRLMYAMMLTNAPRIKLWLTAGKMVGVVGRWVFDEIHSTVMFGFTPESVNKLKIESEQYRIPYT